MMLEGPNTGNILVRNNVFIGRTEDFDAAWGVCVKTNTNILDVSVYNNIFKDIQWDAVGIGATCTGIVKNNIIYNIISGDYGKSYYGNGGNNLLYHPSKTETKINPTDIVANPLFVNVNNRLGADAKPFTADDGLRLQSTSPAINAGASLAGLVDKDAYGTSRPQGSAWDIGPYEYTTATTAVLPTRSVAQDAHTGVSTFFNVNGRSINKTSAKYGVYFVLDRVGDKIQTRKLVVQY
jgi:hypothetical protein